MSARRDGQVTSESGPAGVHEYPRRVLWIGESPQLHTGFGRQTRELAPRLAADAAQHVGLLGWGWEGTLSPPLGLAEYPPGPVPWEPARMQEAIDDFAPDVVITSGPLHAIRSFLDVPSRAFVIWTGYGAFEAAPLSPRDCDMLAQMDVVVALSPWCRNVLDEARVCKRVHTIPLGVDSSVFRRLPERACLRARAGLDGRFVVGCVARNTFRKQIPLLIRAFAQFARDHSDALLYLHMDPDDAGWRLPELLARHGVSDRTALTANVSRVVGVGLQALNEIYNLFDVMALPTMGEAFCLPILEAMAAEVPVVATDCSAVTDWLASRGETIRVKATVTMPWDNAEYALADEDDLVQRLTALYSDPEQRRSHALEGRRFAESMTWERAAKAWCGLVSALVGRQSWEAGDARVRVRTVSLQASAEAMPATLAADAPMHPDGGRALQPARRPDGDGVTW
jgi:glycosyltransferase involved in cell wall biosynthesis